MSEPRKVASLSLSLKCPGLSRWPGLLPAALSHCILLHWWAAEFLVGISWIFKCDHLISHVQGAGEAEAT